MEGPRTIGGTGTAIWGTAANGKMILADTFFRPEIPLGSLLLLTSHEYGHLAFHGILSDNAQQMAWIALFNEMFVLEMDRGSRILYWISEQSVSEFAKAAGLKYEFSPNPSEMFAIAFGIYQLHWAKFKSRYYEHANSEEKRLLDKVFAPLLNKK